jgi:hypothetical protein
MKLVRDSDKRLKERCKNANNSSESTMFSLSTYLQCRTIVTIELSARSSSKGKRPTSAIVPTRPAAAAAATDTSTSARNDTLRRELIHLLAKEALPRSSIIERLGAGIAALLPGMTEMHNNKVHLNVRREGGGGGCVCVFARASVCCG